MMAIEYVRAIVAGVAARIWRVLTGRPCNCDACQSHAEFLDETTAAYVEELRSRGATLERIDIDGTPMWTGDRDKINEAVQRTRVVPTLHEARRRWHR